MKITRTDKNTGKVETIFEGNIEDIMIDKQKPQRYKRIDNLALEMILRMLDHVGVITFFELLQIAIAYDLRTTKDNRTEINRLLDTLNECIIASKDAYKGLGKAVSNVEDYKRKVRGK